MHPRRCTLCSPVCVLLLGVAVVLPLLLWTLERAPVFHRAYTDHLRALEDDAWLRTQCADPIFVARMIRHHDVCQRVRESFQQPALLVALQAVCHPTAEWWTAWSALSWQAVVLLVAVFFLAPGVLLPLYRMRKDHVDHARMLEVPTTTTTLCGCY